MPSVGIVGAGTMGAGIAQVGATSGWTVELLDVSEDVVRRAKDGIGAQLARLVDQGKLSAADRDATLKGLTDPSPLVRRAACAQHQING